MFKIQQHIATDADNGEQKIFEITPDTHGLTVSVQGFDDIIVIDLSKNQVNVYHALDESNDVAHPNIQFDLNDNAPEREAEEL